MIRAKAIPQGLKPILMGLLMSEPFDAQDELKLRPPMEPNFGDRS
jgi:hypothetical protein